MYLRGTLEGSGLVESAVETRASLNRLGPNQVRIEGALPGASFNVLSPAGAVLHRGRCDGQGAAVLPPEFVKKHLILVQAQGYSGMELLKLGTIAN